MYASEVQSALSGHFVPHGRQERDALTAELLSRLADADGAERETLLQRVVEINVPVAMLLARHYAGRGISPADLEQVACLGLVAAARRYDPALGGDFLAFAVPTIKGELRKAFRDLGWVVRPPRRLQELQARVWGAESELIQDLGRDPKPAEIAEHLDVDVHDVTEVLAMDGCFAPTSLDAPLGESTATTVAEQQGAIDPGFAGSEARTMLAPVVRALAPRDRHIIELRFFHGWTQQQIGDEIGVTQMQVSRLLTRILSELRASLERKAQTAA